jgi:uncharacterized protein (TIGR00255 family)
MIKSMTGFGKSSAEFAGKKVTIELRSLNSKSLDLNLRIPYIYKEKEAELRSEISKQAERGKIDATIFIESTQETATAIINKPLAKKYYKELQSLSKELNEKNTDLFSLILKMPEVLKSEKETLVLDEKEWKQVRAAFDKAIHEFQKFRSDEGKSLGKELKNRIDIIGNHLKEIADTDSRRIKNIRKRIEKSLEELIESGKIDKNRLEQELIFYIEKLDISEEKLRLKTHLDYFLKTMKEPSGGRKLGFISQEIGREINTIGSKANNADIQKLVVQMKDELEKIKEQLLNVL